MGFRASRKKFYYRADEKTHVFVLLSKATLTAKTTD